MPNQNENLSRFLRQVISGANAGKDEKIAQLQASKEETVEAARLRFYENSYSFIQETIGRYDREAAAKISECRFETKNKLLEKRRTMSDNLFREVTARVVEFTASPEYGGYIKSLFAGVAAQIPPERLSGGVCFAKAADVELCKRFAPAGVTVEAGADGIIGGFVLKNIEKKYIVDCTLICGIEREKELFLGNKELCV